MDNKNRIFALSTDVLTANKKLLKATKTARADTFEEIDDTLRPEPMSLSMTPMGMYVLTATTAPLMESPDDSGMYTAMHVAYDIRFINI